MDKPVQKPPTHELVYRQIREKILFGEFTPGQSVTIHGLVQEFGAGMTPVREAIRRLTAEGALELQGNRRIILPELSLTQLEELSFIRLSVEPQLALLATKNITVNDIDILYEIDEALNAAISRGNVRGYLELNYRFHHTLYRLAEARILMSVASTMWLQVGPSLRGVLGRFGTANLPDKHEEALAGMRVGDAQAVAQAISDDIKQGREGIRASLSEKTKQDTN